MSLVAPITVTWQEDGSATCLARVTARDATGAATGVHGEGNWIKQADLSTITCKIFDRSGSTPDTALSTPTVTISTAIQDTPVTSPVIWTLGEPGWNFLFDVAATAFPTGGHKYLIEFTFTTTGNTKWIVAFEGIAAPVVSS